MVRMVIIIYEEGFRGRWRRILNIAAESRNYRWHVITPTRIYFTCAWRSFYLW